MGSTKDTKRREENLDHDRKRTMDSRDEQDLGLTLAQHAKKRPTILHFPLPSSLFPLPYGAKRPQRRVASMQINATLNIFSSFQPEIPFYYCYS